MTKLISGIIVLGMSKFYSIKYLMTNGLEEVDGDLSTSGKYVNVGPHRMELLGKEIFSSKEEAASHALSKIPKIRAAAMKSLAKIDKLKEALERVTPTGIYLEKQ